VKIRILTIETPWRRIGGELVTLPYKCVCVSIGLLYVSPSDSNTNQTSLENVGPIYCLRAECISENFEWSWTTWGIIISPFQSSNWRKPLKLQSVQSRLEQGASKTTKHTQ
jgi:hypothetical protein